MENNLKNRTRTGITAGAVGMAANFVLALLKIAAGAVTGLVSVLADGFNSLSDCGSGAVTLFSFRLAAKPADREHPFGHRRAEYIASLAVGFIIIFFGAELLRGSLQKILSGELSQGSLPVYLVLAFSVVVKAALAVYFCLTGKRISSQSLKASGRDCAADCFATLAVIAGMAISSLLSFPADGWAGLVVTLFVVWQGAVVVKEAANSLLGKAADRELTEGIKAYLKAGEGVLGVHDLCIYEYGEDRLFASAHIEMDASVPPLQAHAVLDGLEGGVLQKFGARLTAHLDPVDLTDAEAGALKARISAALAAKFQGVTLHDFRIVRGRNAKVIFDVSAPYGVKAGDGQILSAAEEIVRAEGDYLPVITVDRE